MTQTPIPQWGDLPRPHDIPQWLPPGAGGLPQLLNPGEAAPPALNPRINPATGATAFPTEALGVQPPFFAPQEPDSLARTIGQFVEKAHKLYRQTFESQPEYKAFWGMPARQRLAVYMAHEPVTPWFMALAQVDSPETSKRMRDYATLQVRAGLA